MVKKKLRTERLLSYLKNWSDSTTLHGIGNFATSQNFFVLSFRISIFLSFLTYFLISFINILIGYYALSKNTYLENRISDGVDFPAVTICNLKYYDIKKESLRSQIQDFFDTQLLNQLGTTKHLNLDTFYEYGYSAYRSLDPTSLYRISDMLLSCRFLIAECNAEDFKEIMSQEYGRCFTFNSQGVKKLYKEGNKYGLRLELLVGDALQEDYTKKHGKSINCYKLS